MVDPIATNPKYQEFEAKHNRHLNMLAENVSLPTTILRGAQFQDRNLRKQALVEFNKVIESTSIGDDLIEFYYREKLVRRLIMTLEDQIEKNRELAIEIISK